MTFEFVFTESHYQDNPMFTLLFPYNHVARENFRGFLSTLGVRGDRSPFAINQPWDYCDAVVPIINFPEILKKSIELDIPIWRRFHNAEDREYFASKLIVIWKQGKDGSYHQEVPPNTNFPGTWEDATAKLLSYKYKDFAFVFTSYWLQWGFNVEVDFGFLFPIDAPAVEPFKRFLDSKEISYSVVSALHKYYTATTKIFHFPEVLEVSLSLDIPVWRSEWGSSQDYFSSRIIAPWKQREDGIFCQEVPEYSGIPGTFYPATAELLPYKYSPGCLQVNSSLPLKYRAAGWWPACVFETYKGKTHSRYKGYNIRYLPSKMFLMRFGAYPTGSNRAIAITRSVESCQRAIDFKLGHGPREFDVVLGGKDPKPREFDVVLGGGCRQGDVVAIKTNSITQSSDSDWSFLDDEEILEVD